MSVTEATKITLDEALILERLCKKMNVKPYKFVHDALLRYMAEKIEEFDMSKKEVSDDARRDHKESEAQTIHELMENAHEERIR